MNETNRMIDVFLDNFDSSDLITESDGSSDHSVAQIAPHSEEREQWLLTFLFHEKGQRRLKASLWFQLQSTIEVACRSFFIAQPHFKMCLFEMDHIPLVSFSPPGHDPFLFHTARCNPAYNSVCLSCCHWGLACMLIAIVLGLKKN